MKKALLVIALLAYAPAVFGQSNPSYPPMRAVATLPLTCTTSGPDAFAFKTTSGGDGVGAYFCSATNTWTYLGYGREPVVITDGGDIVIGYAQGSTTSGQLGPLVQCATTTSAPTYVNATTNPINCDPQGNTRVAVTGQGLDGATATLNPVRVAGKDGSGNNQDLATDTSGILSVNMYVGGVAVTAVTDPCDGTAKTPHVVNMSSATTVEIANAQASNNWYICSVNLVAAAAQTVAIGIDNDDGCGSITTGLHGGATAATGWSFAANGGISLGNGSGTVMKSVTPNQYLCIITGQAAQLSGTIMYVAAP